MPWRDIILNVTKKANDFALAMFAMGNMQVAHDISELSAITLECFQAHDYIQSIAVVSILEYRLDYYGHNYDVVVVNPVQ